MSYYDGWAALHLEMPPRVPRTEYSLEYHFELIRRLTGMIINNSSSHAEKQKASIVLHKAFHYDFIWSTLTSRSIFEGKSSDMGHAVYQEGAVDFRRETSFLYDDPMEALRFDPFELYGTRDKASLTQGYDDHYEVNVKNNTDLYCRWIMQYFEALAESKAPVVMIHDDIVWTNGAFIHPDWYRRFVFPNYKRLFAPLHDAKKIIMYTSDGNYSQFIDDIASCGINAFVMEPLTDMAYIAAQYGKTHAFVGNADTRILLSGKKEDFRAEVKRCMDIGKKYPGFFMAVGNHIPPNTPLDNVLYYNDAYEEMSRR